MEPIKPFFFDMTEAEIAEFNEASSQILRSGNLILGEHTRLFEEEFAEFVGARYAVAVNSGSTGLEFLLRLEQVEDKTVLVQTNTNFATVASVLRVGGKVRYLDMDRTTFAPSLEMVRQAVEHPLDGDPPIAGVLWVHIGGVISPEFGHVVDYCNSRGLFVLEDSAHAHGSKVGGVSSGALADGASFSFFPTKVMTTCEGGMMTFENEEWDMLARSLRNQGKRGANFGGLHHDFGNSCRITELGAALGRIQLRKLPEMIKRRQAVYDVIAPMLDEAGIEYVSTAHMDVASQYKMIVLVPDGKSLKEVSAAMNEDNVFPGGTVYELPCHQQPVFDGVSPGGSYPISDKWCPAHLCPPLTSGMDEEQARAVGESLVRHLA
jgi:perosamine synthetase